MKILSYLKGRKAFWCLIFLSARFFHPLANAANPAPIPHFQQANKLSGTVSDASGTLPGVSVSVKGKPGASITDGNGAYRIEALPGEILTFSFIGYLTQEITVGTTTTVNITLRQDNNTLEEVTVNAGYYSVKDKERTGSIAKIGANEIEHQPVANVLATLQGRMAGVNVVQESGIAGGGFKISIRGVNSLRPEANSPLYIIDGTPYSSDPISDRYTSTATPGDGNPLASINPHDVASIEVLKDADATAIYGSRGANGVVLITTKKGKKGKATYTVNTNYSVGSVTRMMDLMDTRQYLKMRREAYANDGISPLPASAYDVNGIWDQDRYTDWQEVLIGGTSEVRFTQASVSGGSEHSSYLFSGNYRTESSVFPGDFTYRKGGARLSVNHSSPDRRFAISFSGSYTVQDNVLPSIDYASLSRQLAPNAPALYDAQGNLNWEDDTWINPLSNSAGRNLAFTTDIIMNTNLTYSIAENLALKASIGMSDLSNRDSNSMPSTMYSPSYNLGSEYSSIYFNTLRRRSWIAEPQLNWKAELGNSAIDLLAGATFQRQTTDKMVVLATGFSSNALLYNLSSASQALIRNNDLTEYGYQAFFGRANYSYSGKYLLNLTARRDGSSRFGPGNQFSTFGAVGAAWLFHREPLIEKAIPLLSFGKLRGSYGTTGSDQIGDYQYLDTYTSSGLSYGGTVGLQPSRLYNPGFGWENNRKLEAAFELGFFKDRVLLSVAWYRNRSSNQLVGYPLPGTTGFTSMQANLDAVVVNTGLEATLQLEVLKTERFSWTAGFNITRQGNRLESFPGLQDSQYRNQYALGQPTTIQKLFQSEGVDPQTGHYRFTDFNGDGVISYEHDRQVVRDFNPEFYGGLQNTLSCGPLRLDFLFQFVKQQNFNFANTNGYVGLMYNQPAAYSDSWHAPGDSAPYQLYTSGSNQEVLQKGEYFGLSDAAVSDASFIRLKNISLCYTLPEKLIPNVGFRLSLEAQNLLTFTRFKGADPEFTQGGQLPPLKVFSVGLQLTF